MRPLLLSALGLLLLCASCVRANPGDCTVSSCPENMSCNQLTHLCEARTNTDEDMGAGDMDPSMCLPSDPRRVQLEVSRTGHDAAFLLEVNGQPQKCGTSCGLSVCPGDKISLRVVTIPLVCLREWEIRLCEKSDLCAITKTNTAQLDLTIAQVTQVIAHLSSCQIRAVSSGVTEKLTDVSGAGGVMYIVGEGGTVLRWNGTTLGKETLGGTIKLGGVALHAADRGVLVGANTAIHLRSQGLANNTNFAGTIALRGVALTSEKLGWAVGGVSQNTAYAMRWDGLNLSDASPGSGGALEAVSGAGNEFWAVGSGSVFRNTGADWVEQRPMDNKDAPMRGVFVAPWGEVWMVGDKGFIQRGNEKGFAQVKEGSIVSSTLRDVWGTSPENVWIVGDSDMSGGVVLRWDGASLFRITPSGAGNLNGVWGSAGADVWFVGDGGKIYRYSPP